MALADVAHIGNAGLCRVRAKTAFCNHAHRLGLHFRQQRVHRTDIETGEALIQAANNLVAHRRAQEADGAAHPCPGGHQHLGNADLLGDPAGMHRPAAAERDQGAAVIGFAGLDRVHARRIGHVLVDHLDHRQGRHRRIQPERTAHLCRQRVLRREQVELHGSPGKPRGVVAAESQIGVGHRRMGAAAAVASRPGIGAGTFRTDADTAQAIDMRDGAAAGADLHHLDNGNTQRQARSLAEPANARDLERAGGLRLVVVDQADLGRGAAHVERQHVADAALSGDERREDRPTGRAAFHQPDREAARRLDRCQAAAGQHQEDRRGDAHRTQVRLQPAQVTRHHRLHIGVCRGGGKPLPLPHLRRNIRRQRDRHVRQRLSKDIAHPAFVDRVDEAMQQADGDALHLFAQQQRHQGAHRVFIQGAQDVALVVQPLRHRQAQVPWDQRLGQHDVKVVLVVAALVAHRQHVAETLGGDQRGAGALALDQRVGRQRRAMHQDGDIRGLQTRRCQDCLHPRHDALLGRGRGGQNLDGCALALMFDRKVGKSAADIDGKSG